MNLWKSLSHTRQGEIMAILEMIILGFIVIWSKQATNVLSPFLVTGLMFFLAGICAGGVMLYKGLQNEIFEKKGVLRDLFVATLIIVILCHSLFFWGTALSSAGNAAILGNTEALFTILIFWFFGEKLTRRKGLGALLILSGALFIVLEKQDLSPSLLGDVCIILACFLAPFGNLFQKRLLQKISSFSLVFWRSIMGGSFLIVLSFVVDPQQDIGKISEVFIPLLLGGVFGLFLSKIFFLEAVKRIGVVKPIVLNASAVSITLVAAFFLLGEIPTWIQLLGFVVIFMGVLLTIDRKSEIEEVMP